MRILFEGLGMTAKPLLRLRRRVLGATIAAILTALLLVQMGCAISSGTPPYPAEWASIKSIPTDDGCPKIGGTYSNFGVATFPTEMGPPPSLAEIFMRMAQGHSPASPSTWKQSWPTIPLDVSAVSIDQRSDKLSMSFIDASGNRTPLNFRRYRFSLSESRVDDLFSCRTLHGEPLLRFFAEPQSYSAASPIFLGGGGTFVVLLKAVDGSLVVNWRSDYIGLSLFVLGSGYSVDSIWYRYPLLNTFELDQK